MTLAQIRQDLTDRENRSIPNSPRGYLISRVARANTSGGIVALICFAVWRLITNSNFAGSIRRRNQFNPAITAWLFYHLIRPIQQRLWNVHSNLFGGFQIDHQLELHRLLHW
jgi:hypothetical protein